MKSVYRLMVLVLVLLLSLSMIIRYSGKSYADFAQGEVRIQVSKDVPEKGTLETCVISSVGSFQCSVYLPYGYDPNDKTKAYDVLVMLPGASGTLSTYFDAKYAYTGLQILDDLFYYQKAEPVIVVTTSSFRSMGVGSTDLMIKIIRGIVETLDENYNTYGNKDIQVKLDEDDELRNHYVLAGFCYSADLLISTLIAPCNDLFSRYGVFSTLVTSNDEQMAAIEAAHLEHPIRYAMISSGTFEYKFQVYTENFGDRMEEIGVPIYRFSYTGIEHGWDDNAFASLYNVVQFMFPVEGAHPLLDPIFPEVRLDLILDGNRPDGTIYVETAKRIASFCVQSLEEE